MSKLIKIEIKSRWFVDKILFSYESVDNTIAKTLQEAYLQGANLQGANLQGANLQGADLQGAYLQEAYLQEAYLQGANLQGANLQGADLRGANLQEADLQGAYLQEAYLQGADLRGANLQEAYLQEAYLQGANLQGANLQGADLRGANLQEAYLQGAYLQGAKNAELAIAMTIVPSEGSIIGWKKCMDNKIVKLCIPEKAKRLNATGRKCRAEFAEVLAIYPKGVKRALAKKETAQSQNDPNFVYKVGEIVKPTKDFDLDRWNECSTGIHFFITREEAEAY